MLKILILILAVISSLSISYSQPLFWTELHVKDCTSETITLIFGYDCNATHCIDGDFGGGVMEKELPPMPPTGLMDARFIDPRGYSDTCIGQGLRTNIIRFPDFNPIDTFQLSIQKSAGCDSLYLSWNPSDFTYFDSIFFKDQFGGFHTSVNMQVESTATLNVNLTQYFIYSEWGVWDMCPTVVDNFDLTLPWKFSLHQNYPNPFNPSTTITYDLPKESIVRLILYDVLGREIRVLVNERQHAGTKSVTFDGSGLPSGIYFYRLQTGQTTLVKKMLLMR